MSYEEIAEITQMFKPRANAIIDINDLTKKDVSIPYYKDDWVVIIPRTFEASTVIGEDTKWCVSTNEEYFDQHTENDTIYMIINLATGRKFGTRKEDSIFINEDDRFGLFDWININVPDSLNQFLYDMTKLSVFREDLSIIDKTIDIFENTESGFYRKNIIKGINTALATGLITREEYDEISSAMQFKLNADNVDTETCRIYNIIDALIQQGKIEEAIQELNNYPDIDFSRDIICPHIVDPGSLANVNILSSAIENSSLEMIYYLIENEIFDPDYLPAATIHIIGQFVFAPSTEKILQIWKYFKEKNLLTFTTDETFTDNLANMFVNLLLNNMNDIFVIIFSDYIPFFLEHFPEVWPAFDTYSEDSLALFSAIWDTVVNKVGVDVLKQPRILKTIMQSEDYADEYASYLQQTYGINVSEILNHS